MSSLATVSIKGVAYWFVRDEYAEMRPVLSDIHLDVRPGEFICLIGPSGCGKTTLLNLIAGVLRPRLGEVQVLIDGRPIPIPAVETGYMLARDALMPWRTAVANVEFGLEVRGVPAPQRRAEATAALEMVGLSGATGLYPAELSQGMRQRVNLARMLVTKPALLLMDEPFGALDALTRERMQSEFLQIWERDRCSVVFVTHDLQEAALLADRVIAMVDGKVAREFEIPFARPRVRDELRLDPEFQRIARELLRTIFGPAA